MGYYKQGDAAKADQIKAAFEKLGVYVGGYDFGRKNVLFFTFDAKGKNYMMSSLLGTGLDNIILTHPDYKELELPVEPKFKVGDRVIHNGKVRTITFMDENYYDFDGGVAGCRIELQDELKPASNFKKGDLLVHNSDSTCRVLVVDVSEKYGYQVQDGGSRYHLSFTTVENEYHLWTIADAKDGDVLVDEYTDTIGIFEETTGIYWHSKIYCAKSTYTKVYHHGGFHHIKLTKPATKEQRALLFARMKEAGYTWDEKKKELRKIQHHYDIANFHAGMPVLVRIDNSYKWSYTLFSHYNEGWNHPFSVASCCSVKQCIPYNKETEHLLGTTDMCPEEYINW